MTERELEKELLELRKLDEKVNKIIKSLKEYTFGSVTTDDGMTHVSRDFALYRKMEEIENGR